MPSDQSRPALAIYRGARRASHHVDERRRPEILASSAHFALPNVTVLVVHSPYSNHCCGTLEGISVPALNAAGAHFATKS
jgi:hypothetical protein